MMSFFQVWLDVMWLFLPALIANQCPGWMAALDRAGFYVPLHQPVSRKWLGENKTWSAYWAGGLGGLATIWVQHVLGAYPYWRLDEAFLAGLLMGLGAILGDHAESFVKRRLKRSPGEVFFPWDQTDFVFGACLLSYPLIGWSPTQFLVLFFSMWIIHPIGNGIGFAIGIRKRWL